MRDFIYPALGCIVIMAPAIGLTWLFVALGFHPSSAIDLAVTCLIVGIASPGVVICLRQPRPLPTPPPARDWVVGSRGPGAV